MFEYLFGRYLMNSKRLTKEKLSGLIERSKLEIVIGRHGFDPNSDAYGEISRLGVIVNRKLSELIASCNPSDRKDDEFTEAGKNYVPNFLFFKGLTRENVISPDDITGELKQFEKHYALDKDGVSKAFETDAEAVLAMFVNSGDYFANQYMTIMLKHILRFVGSNLKFSNSAGVFSYSAERFAAQKVVTAGARYFIGIGAGKSELQRLNDLLADDFASAGQHWHYDNLLSFFNSVSCMFQSLIEKEREIIFVDSPMVYKYSTVSADGQCFMLPLTFGETTRFDLLVGFGEKPNFAKISHNI